MMHGMFAVHVSCPSLVTFLSNDKLRTIVSFGFRKSSQPFCVSLKIITRFLSEQLNLVYHINIKSVCQCSK